MARCISMTMSGRRCRSAAVSGGKYCQVHKKKHSPIARRQVAVTKKKKVAYNKKKRTTVSKKKKTVSRNRPGYYTPSSMAAYQAPTYVAQGKPPAPSQKPPPQQAAPEGLAIDRDSPAYQRLRPFQLTAGTYVQRWLWDHEVVKAMELMEELPGKANINKGIYREIINLLSPESAGLQMLRMLNTKQWIAIAGDGGHYVTIQLVTPSDKGTYNIIQYYDSYGESSQNILGLLNSALPFLNAGKSGLGTVREYPLGWQTSGNACGFYAIHMAQALAADKDLIGPASASNLRPTDDTIRSDYVLLANAIYNGK